MDKLKSKIKRKLKPRFIFCLCATLILAVTYIIYLLFTGGSYTSSTVTLSQNDPTTVKTELSRDDVIKINGVRTEKLDDIAQILVDTEAVGSGEVTLTIRYTESFEGVLDDVKIPAQEIKVDYVLKVTRLGIIFDVTKDSFNGLYLLMLFINAQILVLIITFALSMYKKEKEGEFSYSMVMLGGIIFFLTIYMGFSVYTLFTLQDFKHLIGVEDIFGLLYSDALGFIVVTVVPLIILAFLLSLSNIRLVIREGFRPQNLLGVLLGAAVIGAIALMIFLDNHTGYDASLKNYLVSIINIFVAFTFGYLECMLASTIFCALASTRYKIRQPMDYIIILGCAIRRDGTPTPILRGRIDRALSFEHEQYEKHGVHAKFVPSGGQGSNEVISEAESMKRYLMEQGVPGERILKEDKSVNTFQNMKFSKKIIGDDSGESPDAKIAFSTTNYHVFRGYTLAEQLKMNVKGLSAKTKLYFFPNAFLREFIGLLWEKRLRHMIILILGAMFMAAIYLILSF